MIKSFITAVGKANGSWCFVCGELSLQGHECIDDYIMKETDKKDCREVPGHTEGCIKAKYVDNQGRQIGKHRSLTAN